MLKILGRRTSGNVMKPVWVLDELGLEYEREDIGGKFGGNREAGLPRDEPHGTGARPSSRTSSCSGNRNAITRYLCEKYGHGSLCPADPRVRAHRRHLDGLAAADHVRAHDAAGVLGPGANAGGGARLRPESTPASSAATRCGACSTATSKVAPFVAGDELHHGRHPHRPAGPSLVQPRRRAPVDAEPRSVVPAPDGAPRVPEERDDPHRVGPGVLASPGGRVTRERTPEGDPDPPEAPAPPPSPAPRARPASPRTARAPARGSEAGSAPGSDRGSEPSRGATRTGRPSAAAGRRGPGHGPRRVALLRAPHLHDRAQRDLEIGHPRLPRPPSRRHHEPRRVQRRVHRLLRLRERDRGLVPRDHLLAAGPPLDPPPAPLLLPHHRRAGRARPRGGVHRGRGLALRRPLRREPRRGPGGEARDLRLLPERPHPHRPRVHLRRAHDQPPHHAHLVEHPRPARLPRRLPRAPPPFRVGCGGGGGRPRHLHGGGGGRLGLLRGALLPGPPGRGRPRPPRSASCGDSPGPSCSTRRPRWARCSSSASSSGASSTPTSPSPHSGSCMASPA